MIKNIKDFFKRQGYFDLKKKVIFSLVVLIITIFLTIFLITLFYPKSCEDRECFSDSLNDCDRVSLVREDSSASWYYEILGNNDENSCKVSVKLLKLKQGKIDIEDLEGEEMTCIVSKGETLMPEENIESCTGILKEELQGIIIEKMHSYILKNIGDIKDSFGLNNPIK
jgi:hypothetical protein